LPQRYFEGAVPFPRKRLSSSSSLVHFCGISIVRSPHPNDGRLGERIHAGIKKPFSYESIPVSGNVAYFSMEIAIHPSMPTYSGGLGVLAETRCARLPILVFPHCLHACSIARDTSSSILTPLARRLRRRSPGTRRPTARAARTHHGFHRKPHCDRPPPGVTT